MCFPHQTGLQFHENQYLFAAPGRRGQMSDDRRLAADPVQRLFDGQNIRILGSLANQLNHRIERLVRVVQKDIRPSDRRKQVAFSQRRHRLR